MITYKFLNQAGDVKRWLNSKVDLGFKLKDYFIQIVPVEDRGFFVYYDKELDKWL